MDDFHPLEVWGSSLSSGAFLPEMEGRTRGEARAAARLPAAAAALPGLGAAGIHGQRRGPGRERGRDAPSCRPPAAQSPPLFRSLRSVPGAQTSRGPLRLCEGSRVLTVLGRDVRPAADSRSGRDGGGAHCQGSWGPLLCVLLGPRVEVQDQALMAWSPAGGFLESGFMGISHLPKAVKEPLS